MSRVLLYGRPANPALAAWADEAQAAGARVVWRRDTVFTPDQVEAAAQVACLAGAPSTPAIAAAYQARGVAVVVIDDAPPPPSDPSAPEPVSEPVADAPRAVRRPRTRS